MSAIKVKVVPYKDGHPEEPFRWRLLHADGHIMADSGHGHSRKEYLRKELARMRDAFAHAELHFDSLLAHPVSKPSKK